MLKNKIFPLYFLSTLRVSFLVGISPLLSSNPGIVEALNLDDFTAFPVLIILGLTWFVFALF